MKNMIEYIVQSLVDHPDQVQIEEENREDVHYYYITVSPEDTGKVIGKEGRIIKSIGTVVSSVAKAKDFGRVMIKVHNAGNAGN